MNKIAFLIAGVLLCGPAMSADPQRALQELNYRAWTVPEGAPPNVTSMVQTDDGTLWLGSIAGLFRFDGVRFTAFTGPPQPPFESNEIYTLTASPDGGLWIGFRWGGVSFLKDGRVDHYGEKEGIGPRTVSCILIDRNGTVWVAGIWGLSRQHGSRFEPVVFDGSDPHAPAWSVLEDRAGTLWVLGQNSLVARPAGSKDFLQIAQRTYKSFASKEDLAEAADGSMWAAHVDERGPLRLELAANGKPTDTRLIPLEHASTLFFDPDGSLWFSGEIGAVGRIPSAALRANLNEHQIADRAEYFTNAEGSRLTDATFFLDDREGNLWISTSSLGIDRLSPSNVVKVAVGVSSQSAIAAGEGGSLIAAVKVSETKSRIMEIRESTVVRESSGPWITSTFRDADGTIWLNGPEGISKYENGRIETTPAPADADHARINTMTRDGKGDLWVAYWNNKLFRLSEGTWHQVLLPALPRKTVYAAATDARGQVWLGYNKQLAIVNGTDVRLLGESDELKLGAVGAIVARQTHVWVGGELGLLRFEGSRMSFIRSTPGNPLVGISGIIETAAGDLWLNTSVGIVHISNAELERSVADSSYRVQYEAFTFADGVPGLSVLGPDTPTIVEATDGRIWFYSAAGLAYIDPTRIRRNALPPPVTIWSIGSGSTQYPATLPAIQLPVHTTNVQISYTAASLTVPERVRFRYKLEGLDREWQDARDRREVAFSNLRPGPYKFHVTAANNDGVWNTVGASVSFTIVPAFYQTKWFYGLCAILCVAFLWFIYLMRIRQVSAQVRSRLEDRLAERERIARDLHDTLLQSVQGLLLRLRAAVARLPKQVEGYVQMEQALERADEVVTEGRDRVKHLRASPNLDADLPAAIGAVGEEMATQQSTHFRSTVDGTPRDLHPIVREEALFIAREALINAFRHASARQIETEIFYGKTELLVRIRDNGEGIDAAVLQHGGRDGHFGLLGMRERANKIRATLTIWSKPGAGTEVDLRVPANVAYRSRQRAPIRWWQQTSNETQS